MGQSGRRQAAVYVLAAVVVVLLGARYLRPDGGEGGGAGSSRPVPVRVSGGGGADAGGWAVVQVAGEVRSPGVYRLRAGKRVDDAVRMAGGPTARAELAGVNLAAKVEDGRQVIVPARVGGTAANAAGGGSAASPSPVSAAAGAPGAPLNLNTATPEQLDELDGVGPATAEKIVAYRQAHGGFRSVNELDQVPGIGPKRLAALKPLLTV
ncbi:MAG TPA: ComEA family DNA-binding protein [Solirubrobacteraceae bacterium]|nr:ComEA family DNA-binding protein [Solirubrobacteraceae bacterium]